MFVKDGFVNFTNKDIKDSFDYKESVKYENWMKYIKAKINSMNPVDRKEFWESITPSHKRVILESKIALEDIQKAYERGAHLDRVNGKTGESEYDGFNATTGNGWMTQLMFMTQEINEVLSMYELNKEIQSRGYWGYEVINNSAATHGNEAQSVSVAPDFVVKREGKNTPIQIELQTVHTTSTRERNPLIFKYSKWKNYQNLVWREKRQVYHIVKNINTDNNSVEFEVWDMTRIVKEISRKGEFIPADSPRAMGYCSKGAGTGKGYSTMLFDNEDSYAYRTTINCPPPQRYMSKNRDGMIR